MNREWTSFCFCCAARLALKIVLEAGRKELCGLENCTGSRKNCVTLKIVLEAERVVWP